MYSPVFLPLEHDHLSPSTWNLVVQRRARWMDIIRTPANTHGLVRPLRAHLDQRGLLQTRIIVRCQAQDCILRASTDLSPFAGNPSFPFFGTSSCCRRFCLFYIRGRGGEPYGAYGFPPEPPRFDEMFAPFSRVSVCNFGLNSVARRHSRPFL